MSLTDADLLRRYTTDGSESAFAELVERHLNLVYSVARRHVASSSLAEDVAQSVFIELARHARRIDPEIPLIAWLHVVSRRIALNTMRSELRRQARETAAAELDTMKPTPSVWADVEPLLDEAVETLAPADRSAILLRFFEKKSLRDIGAALGTTEDTAQKRVSRAVEQLRTFFLRRGVAVTATGLASDLSAHALQIAPVGLGATISTTATFTVASATATAVETSRLIAMTTLQKSVALAAIVVVAGAGFYQARLVARQSAEAADLGEQNARVSAEIHDLRLARAADAAKLKEIEQRIDARLAAALPVALPDAALESQMQQWLAQVDRMKEFLAQRPEWNIPELKLLSEEIWFGAAKGDRFETEEQFRRATAGLRDRAVGLASNRIMKALNAYIQAHDGMLPNSTAELAPHFDPPIAPEILARYEMRQTGKASAVPRNEAMHIIEPKAPADVEFDAYSYIGTNGYGNSGIAILSGLRDAQRQFAKANNGLRATAAEQLLPYLKWPVSTATLQKYLDPQPPSGRP